MPVYFGYKNQVKYNIIVEIPKGYILESMPIPIKIATEDKNIIYIMNFSNEGNKIQISCLQMQAPDMPEPSKLLVQQMPTTW